MTTSRHAAKVALARKDPRAAFLVEGEGRAVVLAGLLETFDPRSLNSQVRAALEGPGFAWNLTGYALKNASFIGGYLLELASVPAEWWPHNRVLLRLRVERARQLRTDETVVRTRSPRARLTSVPAEVWRSLERAGGYLCWPTLRDRCWPRWGGSRTAPTPCCGCRRAWGGGLRWDRRAPWSWSATTRTGQPGWSGRASADRWPRRPAACGWSASE